MRGTACIGTDWEIVSRIGASRRFLVVYSTHRAACATPLTLAACAVPLVFAPFGKLLAALALAGGFWSCTPHTGPLARLRLDWPLARHRSGIVSRIGASRRFLGVYSTHRAACATPLRLAACAVPLTLADWAIAF